MYRYEKRDVWIGQKCNVAPTLLYLTLIYLTLFYFTLLYDGSGWLVSWLVGGYSPYLLLLYLAPLPLPERTC